MICKVPGCENYVEGNIEFCASHNHARRKEAKDALKVTIVKPVRKVSEKMAKALQTYSVKRAIHLKKHPDCQIKLVGCQNNRATNSVHHSGKRGKNLNAEETFMTACNHCHNQIETRMSAVERRAKGFLISK